MGRPYIDLTNKQFDKITVLHVIENSGGKGKGKQWWCRCECGTEWSVRASHLIKGDVTQCKNCRQKNLYQSTIKHGVSSERLYSIWLGMKKRCYSSNYPSYENYGQRGIVICDEWGADKKDIEYYYNFRDWALRHGYKDNLTIERKDVNGPYTPDNCTWVTQIEQQYNKTNTIYLTVDGVTLPLSKWAKKTGIKYSTLLLRIKNKWSHKDAVTIPVNSSNKYKTIKKEKRRILNE